MAIRYIKDDGYHFYIVTEDNHIRHARPKDGAKLINTTDTTWTIELHGRLYTYDENNNLVQSRYV